MADVRDSKLGAPSLAGSHVRRDAVYSRLDEVFGRRVATVVAGPGFGKSTALAAWSADTICAWCTLDSGDVLLPRLAASLVEALRRAAPSVADGLELSVESAGGAGDASRVDVLASRLCESLDARLRTDVVLVLDDLHELPVGCDSSRLIESICRQAPPELHLILSSRAPIPFPIDRLRGRGQVVEVDAALLAFSREEVATFLTSTLGAADLAAPVHELTGGWPAGVRLAGESLRVAPADERQHVLAGLTAPDGPLFAYLAGEVFSGEPQVVRETLRLLAPLPRVDADLCERLGAPHAPTVLAELAMRGVFVHREPGPGDAFTIHGLLREFVDSRWPLDPGERERVYRCVAEWAEARGNVALALRSTVASGDRQALVDLLTRRGPDAVAAGAIDDVLRAGELLAPHERRGSIELAIGDAHRLRGEWQEALACFERAAAGDEVSAALALRMGRIHWDRGEYDEALAAYRRGRSDGSRPADEAQLLAFTCIVLWNQANLDDAREAASSALDAAREAADPRALAAAHYACALVAVARDEHAFEEHSRRALEAAQAAGDLHQRVRILLLVQGPLPPREALPVAEEAVAVAELAGADLYRAAAFQARGAVKRLLGRLDEALVDLERARALWERHGSTRMAWALDDLGALFAARGDLARARSCYEQALSIIDRHPEAQGLAANQARLARVLVRDEPDRALELAVRAADAGRAIGLNAAESVLTLGWVTLARGDREGAARLAAEAAEITRPTDIHFAEALELRALSAAVPVRELPTLEEALTLWRELGNEVRAAAVELALARLSSPPDHAGALIATRRLRALGVRESAASAAGLLLALGPESATPLAIQTLGAFRIFRDGVAVPATAWQSKKARDALKLLVAERGRPVARSALIEALWPDEEPTKTPGRLSVALSRIRAVLDPDHRLDEGELLVTVDETVALNLGAVAVDVEEFMARAQSGLRLVAAGRDEEARTLLEAAESSYTGDFLAENRYDDWAMPVREEARAAYVSTATALAGLSESAGNHDAAIRYWFRVLELDPFDEPAHLGLVAAFAGSGRHGEARRAYRTYVARMEHIRVEPVPFTESTPPSRTSRPDRPRPQGH